MNRDEVAQFLNDMSGGKYAAYAYQTREEWLFARNCSIGASEAAAVMGKSPWMNERQLWEKKSGKANACESAGNADTMRGSLSESHIRELYAIETGLEVLDGTNIIIRSVEHPWMTCSLDGIIVHREPTCSIAEPVIPVIMEIKSARAGADWTDDTMPNYYLIQVLHQLSVTGWDEARLVARHPRSKDWPKAFEREYTVRREDYEKEIEKLVEKERKFWYDNVQLGKPPKVRVPTI